ncbi:MAG: SRPBCC family protein [Acidobacteria bacterium]|nr:SRPBCC family protein [Acidobacteriota bacterium]
MADQTEASIEIAAAPEAIMAAVTDYEAYPEWASGVKKVEILERDSEGRGSKVHYEVAQGPVKADYTLAYDYDSDGRHLSWTFVEGHGMRDLSGSYALEPKGEATVVTYRLRAEISLPLPGFLKRQAEKTIIDTALKGLKRRVESEG